MQQHAQKRSRKSSTSMAFKRHALQFIACVGHDNEHTLSGSGLYHSNIRHCFRSRGRSQDHGAHGEECCSLRRYQITRIPYRELSEKEITHAMPSESDSSQKIDTTPLEDKAREVMANAKNDPQSVDHFI